MSARSKYPNLPISPAFYDFMDLHPEFEKSLKLYNQARFVPIAFFFLTRTPAGAPHEEDQVIGMWYIDKENLINGRKPYFKQDFVVNLKSESKEFVSYSADFKDPPYVRPMDEFFKEYGDGKRFYHRKGKKPWVHHYDDIGDLPDSQSLIDDARRLKDELLRAKL